PGSTGDGDPGDGDAGEEDEPCAEGTWDHDDDAATDCDAWTTCAFGEFVASQGSDSTDRQCSACPVGSFSDQENAEECVEWTVCPSGAATAGNASRDVECASPVVDVAVGDGFSCVLRDEGSVWCWGRNDAGQLGRGNTEHSGLPAPVMVEAQDGLEPLTHVVQLSAGPASACAVRDNGAVWCWGNNSLGQVSLDSDLAGGVVSAAGRVEGVDNATLVTAGKEHSCAVLDDTTVTCWGMARRVFHDPNDEECWGSVGTTRSCDGATYTFQYVDQEHGIARVTYMEPGSTTQPLHDVVDLEAGGSQTCSVRADGSSVCWRGWYPEEGLRFALTDMGMSQAQAVSAADDRTCWLSEGSKVTCGGHRNKQDPLLVGEHQLDLPADLDVTLVESRKDGLCLLGADGTVWCQGVDAAGELTGVVTQVEGLEGIARLSAPFGHACAVDDSGRVYCWGSNTYGELGDFTIFQSTRPVRVPDVDHAVALTSGTDHTCALLDSGKVKCWGKNDLGQLGIGTGIPMSPPIQLGISDVTAINSKYEVTYAVKADDTLRVWGSDELGHFVHPTVDNVVSPTDALAVGVGAAHACASLHEGDFICWGVNTFGALGNDGRHEFPELGETDDLESQYPPLGQNTYFDPFIVSGVRGATDVAAGDAHTCALVDGSVLCWGLNVDGQVGPDGGYYNGIPLVVPGLSAIRQIEAGENFSLGLDEEGALYAWGANAVGQLGNGTFAVTVGLAQVHGVDQTVALAAGHFHACAIIDGGAVNCWGLNDAGQLGSGKVGTNAFVPQAVTGLDGATGISAGLGHSCALHEDGGVSCWGSNEFYQLGHGRVAQSAEPREIIWQ
ncbi:MAG TPA: hypothetical protein VN764_04375, partial [Polyangiaceae bacterium]|nr:hypothetical protein [Polyangiaceae bacterium]